MIIVKFENNNISNYNDDAIVDQWQILDEPWWVDFNFDRKIAYNFWIFARLKEKRGVEFRQSEFYIFSE